MQPGDAPLDTTTRGHLLGGRVAYMQPAKGFRSAIDPVLLAAAIPARPGERVLEGGTGAGAALLCLAARIPGLAGLGIDRDVALIRLARANALANAWPDLWFATADMESCPAGTGTMDHAFANPPYHPENGTVSPESARDTAKRATAGLLGRWAAALAWPLRHRGTLTFIVAPWLLEDALASMRDAGAPAETIFPIWPKAGRKARFILLRGRKNGRTQVAIGPGLILHADSGGFRAEAETILRDGAALSLDGA